MTFTLPPAPQVDYGTLRNKRGRPATVMQILPALNSGGVERSCIDVAEAVMKAGGKAIVVSSGGRWVSELTRFNATHITLPVHSKNPLRIWLNSKRLAKLIRDHEVDIVHARSRAPAWSIWMAAQKTGVPFMTTFHAAYKFSSKLKKRYNSVMSRGQLIIAISHYIAQHIWDNYAVETNRIRIIHRGTRLDQFNPITIHPERMIKLARAWDLPEDKPMILMPSRLTRIKGHHVLIEALSKLPHRNWFCIIAGAEPDNMPYQNELMDLIRSHGLEQQIRLVGHLSDVAAAMRLSHMVVAPSIVPEGLGRMPIEAQAVGVPVVISKIGGTPETVLDGETGFLVAPDDAEDMARGMQAVFDMTQEQRDRMAEHAIAFVHANFGKEDMQIRTLDVYREILS